MKQLFIRYASWLYLLSAALLLGGVMICIIGWHRYVGAGIAIIGFALAAVADAIVPLAIRKKRKD